VTAADDWGGPAERKQVRAAMRDSYERLFHEVDDRAFWLALANGSSAAADKTTRTRCAGF
jgi:erythromycin esterase-like protein